MYYIKVGDCFTPLEGVKEIGKGHILVKNNGINRYIGREIGRYVEIIELKNGKAEYFKGEKLFVDLYGENVEILLR